MKSLSFLCCLFCFGFSSSSQYLVTIVNENAFLRNVDGTFIQKATTYIEEGFNTLPAKNAKVTLITKDGKVYRNVFGRIDLSSDRFIFSMNDQEFVCELPIEKIIFDSSDATVRGAFFKTGYPPVNKQNVNPLYEVLAEGKASLLKHHGVKWQDIIPFHNTNTTRIFTQEEQYYLYLNGKMVRLKKSKDHLINLLSLPKQIITKNKYDPTNDEDAIKLVDYYNSL